jgi:hypothetical protein
MTNIEPSQNGNSPDRLTHALLLSIIAESQDGNPLKWLHEPDFNSDPLSALLADAVAREGADITLLQSRLKYYAKQLKAAADAVDKLNEE